MSRSRYLVTLFISFLAVAVWLGSAFADRRPNLIFIMVDDLGKAPIGCYNDADANSTLTPHIDAMARGGMRLTNFYSMPQCTPTRVALLTSQYPFRNGWVNHFDVPRWDLKGFAPDKYPCFGQVIKSAGYATCIAGKWQISDFRDEPDILQRCGFDSYCMWTGAESGNPPSNKRYWDAYLHTAEGSKTYKDKFGPEVCNNFVLDFVREHKDRPFFVYYPLILTHGPLEPPPSTTGGKQTPEADAASAAPSKKNRKGRRKDKSKSKGNKDANVRYMDELVGRVINVLDETGIRKNTIVIWTTDNGPQKGRTSEAGVCEPFVVNGPGAVPAGVTRDALVDITDIFPTFAELAGAEMPTDLPVDGHSFANLITGTSDESQREWIMAMGGGACKRDAAQPGTSVPGFNKTKFRDRIVRTKTHKLYIDGDRKPEKLVRMADGREGENILANPTAEDQAIYKQLMKVVNGFPETDANPQY